MHILAPYTMIQNCGKWYRKKEFNYFTPTRTSEKYKKQKKTCTKKGNKKNRKKKKKK